MLPVDGRHEFNKQGSGRRLQLFPQIKCPNANGVINSRLSPREASERIVKRKRIVSSAAGIRLRTPG